MLDCQLNDPSMAVKLYRATLSDQSNKQEVNPEIDPSVTKNGQKFTIDVSKLTVGNDMQFECRAIGSGGKILLEKRVTLQKVKGLNLAIPFTLRGLHALPVMIQLSALSRFCH